MHILIINGPNLNLLGRRETAIYGERTFEEFLESLCQKYSHVQIDYLQSNHEGVIIDRLQEVGYDIDGIIINPAAYTHTSIAIADTIKAIHAPVIEVHISDIYSREKYRHISYTSEGAIHSIVGKGLEGYDEAIAYIVKYLSEV